MTAARIALLAAMVVVLPTVAVTMLLPSVTTLDVNVITDRIQLEVPSDLAFDGQTIALSEATVCGEAFSFSESSPSAATNSCQLAHRTQLYAIFNGHVDIQGPHQLTAQRLKQKELEIAIVSMGPEGSITLYDQGRTTRTTRGAYIRVRPKYFEDGNIFSFVTRVGKAVIGGTGGTDGDTRGVLLTGGTAVPLATSFFGSDIIRGTPVSLSMGDILEFDPGQSGPANVILRAESTPGIRVAARLPIVELRISNFAGRGVPISMTWWARLTAEPVLVLFWALAGAVVTLLDWKGKFLASRDRPELGIES
jgi:hypothetical protein